MTKAEKQMSEDERFVRNHWDKAALRLAFSPSKGKRFDVWVLLLDHPFEMSLASCRSEREAWHEARAFTQQRLRAVQETEDAIAAVRSGLSGQAMVTALFHLEAIRDNLKRGMK